MCSTFQVGGEVLWAGSDDVARSRANALLALGDGRARVVRSEERADALLAPPGNAHSVLLDVQRRRPVELLHAHREHTARRPLHLRRQTRAHCRQTALRLHAALTVNAALT